MADLFSKFISELAAHSPSAVAHKKNESALGESVRALFADHVVELPAAAYEKIKKSIHDIFHYSRTASYQKALREELALNQRADEIEILDKSNPRQASVLMAYDYHYDPATRQISLIEINTNASGFLFADLVYKTHGFAFADQKRDTALELLFRSFQKESETLKKALTSVAIIDENTEAQKMFLEFLLYKDFFGARHVTAEILEFNDSRVLYHPTVYNRFNDFTFRQTESQKLRNAYLNQENCFTPQPAEYIRLAHKERLIRFYGDRVCETLIPTFVIDKNSDREQIWSDRKKLFFKPRALFGSKATYRGSSISRKHFDQIFEQTDIEYLAQEYRPAGQIEDFKFDLRFYVYQDQVQIAVARTYQGQVTNFNTRGGGFAPIKLN